MWDIRSGLTSGRIIKTFVDSALNMKLHGMLCCKEASDEVLAVAPAGS
jgi:hypothetical protein